MMPTVEASQEPSTIQDTDDDMAPFGTTDPSSSPDKDMDMDMMMSSEPPMPSFSSDMSPSSGMDSEDDDDNDSNSMGGNDSLIPFDSMFSQPARRGTCAASLSTTSALACTRFAHVGDIDTVFGTISVRVRQMNGMFEVRLNSMGSSDMGITLAIARMGESSSESVRETSSSLRRSVTLKIGPTQIDGGCCTTGEAVEVSVVVVVAQGGDDSESNSGSRRRARRRARSDTGSFKSEIGRFPVNVECVNACAGSSSDEVMVMLTQQGCPVCV